MRYLTFESAAAQDSSEHQSATPLLQLGVTQFVWSELSLHLKAESCPDLRLDSLRCGGSIGRHR
jgi:hypothetical protein